MAGLNFQLGVTDSRVEIPVKHEVLFPQLTKAGFSIDLQSNEDPKEALLALFDNIRNQIPEDIEKVADILRLTGHSHLGIFLHTEKFTPTEDYNLDYICKHYPEIKVEVIAASACVSASDSVYKMMSSPRGLALVINNREFGDDEPRYGSERDFKYLQDLFDGLGYKVFHAENLSALEMKNCISNFSRNPDHKFLDSCIVAISSHGISRDTIQASDGDYIDLNYDVLTPFNNVNCPDLKGKPKLFFIQACRGNKRDYGSDVVDSKALRKERPDLIRYPSWSDVAIIQSTVSGYVSNRSQCEGSWFVQAIVKVFMTHAHDTDLETMLKMVTGDVMRFQSYDSEMQAPEIIYRGWNKSLYFNPGVDE